MYYNITSRYIAIPHAALPELDISPARLAIPSSILLLHHAVFITHVLCRTTVHLLPTVKSYDNETALEPSMLSDIPKAR